MPIAIQLEDHTDDVSAQIEDGAARVVRASGGNIQADAYDLSALLTGAQRLSIYVRTDDSSDYARAVADADEARPGVRVFDEVEVPEDHLTALIAVAVEYAEENELERQAFLVPAAEAERPQFVAALEAL